MKGQRAYKFRLYPDREQAELFQKTFGCCRFLYNHMLADKTEMYEKTGKMKRLTPAGYKKGYPWLKEVDSLALANVQLHLEAAYKKYFSQEKAGHPKFKSKHRSSSIWKRLTGTFSGTLPSASPDSRPDITAGQAIRPMW